MKKNYNKWSLSKSLKSECISIKRRSTRTTEISGIKNKPNALKFRRLEVSRDDQSTIRRAWARSSGVSTLKGI